MTLRGARCGTHPAPHEVGRALAAAILIVILLATFLGMALTDRLTPVRVADTRSYIDAAHLDSVGEALSVYRTTGFPLLIRAFEAWGLGIERIPAFQIAAYLSAVLVFFYAVRRYTGSAWLALAAALPLPFAGVVRLASLLQPDFLAAVFALFAVSGLLCVDARPRAWWGWLGVAIGVPLAYHFRPAAQFLVVLVPLLSGFFLVLRQPQSVRSIVSRSAAVALVTLVPFLLFCGLRGAIVGSFGLVSFGGTNVAAAVTNFLDGRLIQELPKRDRPLAKRILQQRKVRGWEPMRLDSDPIPHFQQANENLWRIGRPAAEAVSQLAAKERGNAVAREDAAANVEWDRRLGRLAFSIIRNRPALYLKWVREALAFGMNQLFDFLWIVGPLLLLAISLPIAWLQPQARHPAESLGHVEFAGSRAAHLTMLAVLAIGYFASYLLLVSMTLFPFDRYFVSTTLFIPTALSAALFELWRGILHTRASVENSLSG